MIKPRVSPPELVERVRRMLAAMRSAGIVPR